MKDQDEEIHRLCYSLQTKGLTTEQVGEVFGEIYGHPYSKQSISRMASATKDELLGWLEPTWLERPLDSYHPIVDVDCTFVPVRRDGISGIENATARQFPNCEHQLCAAHLKRGTLAKVRPKRRGELAEELEGVFQIS